MLHQGKILGVKKKYWRICSCLQEEKQQKVLLISLLKSLNKNSIATIVLNEV